MTAAERRGITIFILSVFPSTFGRLTIYVSFIYADYPAPAAVSLRCILVPRLSIFQSSRFYREWHFVHSHPPFVLIYLILSDLRKFRL